MRKSIIIAISFLFVTLSYGQNVPKTILWKVAKPGRNNESFLFGTFHEVSPSFFDSLSTVRNKLLQSKILFVEERIAKAIEQPLDKQHWNALKWNAILTEEQSHMFTEFVKKSEDSSYYKLNPLLLTLTTSRLYLTNFCATDTAFTDLMDHHIEKLALGYRKQVYSLDDHQNTLLEGEAKKLSPRQDSLYASYSIHFMKSMLTNDLSGCDLINSYKNFDLNYEFDTDLIQNVTHSPLLTERNKKWIQTLHKVFSSNSCFVAVGFRHLFYKQGLIQQLRQLGYSVTPVPIIK